MKSQPDAASRMAAEVVTQLPVPSRLGMLRFERLNEASWALLFLDPNCERQFGLPAVELCALVDSPYASLMEPEPVADAIRRWMPTGLLAHIQFNGRNRRGPGQGDDKFAPVLRALRETGYGGWIAMEPFVYEPDGPTCAARMIGYVAGLLELGA